MGDAGDHLPMMATAGALPPESEDDRWGYEMKWDGVRAVCTVRDGRLRLMSRNARDMTAGYPEIGPLAAVLGARECVLDGELVAFDAAGRPSFGALGPRIHQRGAAKIDQLRQTVPVTYLIFDVLRSASESLLDLPYTERRAVLIGLGLSGPHWDVPPHFVGCGAAAAEHSRRMRLEGVVAKRLDSPYRPGRRVPFWVKVKNMRTQEVVIAGWKPGGGRRTGMIGSLLVGVNDGGLRYAGGVGTGFTERMLRDLMAELAPLERPGHPFAEDPPRADTRNAHWVEPKLVGEARYTERTGENRLRHPSWRGLRRDKTPDEVVWEE